MGGKKKFDTNYYSFNGDGNKGKSTVLKNSIIQQKNNSALKEGLETLIAVPALSTVPVDFVISLMGLKKPKTKIMFSKTTILAQARDNFANIALLDGYKYILFIDSDMTFPDYAYERLLSHEADIVTGLCFARRGYHDPCVYKEINYEDESIPVGQRLVPETDINRDYFEVKACGMAFCLIKTDVLANICATFDGQLFKYISSFGEDLSFCIRALECGYKIYCDATIPIGHIGEETFTKAHYEAYKKLLDQQKAAQEAAAQNPKTE